MNDFLVSALDIPLRPAHAEDLMRHYLGVLASYPRVELPTLDDAYPDYGAASVNGLLAWLGNPTVWPSEEINTATHARFAAAASDFDTYGILGA